MIVLFAVVLVIGAVEAMFPLVELAIQRRKLKEAVV